jgi:hypothetical protein
MPLLLYALRLSHLTEESRVTAQGNSAESLDSARYDVSLSDKPNMIQGEEELSGAGWVEVRTGVFIR